MICEIIYHISLAFLLLKFKLGVVLNNYAKRLSYNFTTNEITNKI